MYFLIVVRCSYQIQRKYLFICRLKPDFFGLKAIRKPLFRKIAVLRNLFQIMRQIYAF